MKRFTSIALAIIAIVIAFATGRSTISAQNPPVDPIGVGTPSIVVTTEAELQSALSPANAGARILIRAGVYDVSQALTVPDRATLLGHGVMSFDESGLPTGFEPSGRTLVRATTTLVGNVLSLGDGATVRGLVIEDVVGRPVAGNPVAVFSRAAGDFVSARVEECEIINPNPGMVQRQGATGRGLIVSTLNPDLEPPHEGAVLRVQMTQSIVRSPGAGRGVFAINFASHAEINIALDSNVIGGGLDAVGGVGRPDAVTGASMIIQSRRNLYRSDSPVPSPMGWFLSGGADVPSPLFVSQASTFNSLQIHSVDDTVAGFATGISAAGGRRQTAISAPISSNRVELNLFGTRLQTTTTDLRLFGASSSVAVSTGDENTVRILLAQATGSGARANQYAHSATPPMGSPGIGNRLEIVGNANAFDQNNQNFLLSPPAEFFTGGQ